MVLAIGAKDNIRYEFKKLDELIKEYFVIIEEDNTPIIEVINKHEIVAGKRVFPVFGFSSINDKINNIDKLKELQLNKIETHIKSSTFNTYNPENSKYTSTKDIIDESECSKHKKDCLIFWNLYYDFISLDDVEKYLKTLSSDQMKETNNKRLLCLYDWKKYKI